MTNKEITDKVSDGNGIRLMDDRDKVLIYRIQDATREDERKSERNRIIKLISQMPELGAGVNANHMATVEQVALRDRIIEEIRK